MNTRAIHYGLMEVNTDGLKEHKCRKVLILKILLGVRCNHLSEAIQCL